MNSSHAPRHPGSVTGDMTDLPETPFLNAALSAPWGFLSPTMELHDTIIGSAKYFIDSLARSISDTQTARQQQNKKRKRCEADQDYDNQGLQLKHLFVEGFGSDQIWEQAIRVLDSAGQEIQRDYMFSLRNDGNSSSKVPLNYFDNPSPGGENSEDSKPGSFIKGMLGLSDTDDGVSTASNPGLVNSFQGEIDSQGSFDEDLDEETTLGKDESDGEQRDTYTEDPFGLNDGFFSIEDFNTQSELWERQDTQGHLHNEAESDEEEVDWHTDPLSVGNASAFSKKPLSLKGKAGMENGERDDEDDDDHQSDEGGSMFDNIILQNGSDSDENDVYDDAAHGTEWVNTSDIKYSDFFAPPPRKAATRKLPRLLKTQPVTGIHDNDIDRAMADVRRDLFEDEASTENIDASDGEPARPENQKSTHEKQRARIADEIRRLEAGNVAKKKWMVAGEVRAAERPMNSLIEEDLEVERVGKPVPIVTAEISEDIEGLVKRRILTREFDEVIRRRPGVTDEQNPNQNRFELEDTKPQKSLAELYETDHLQATDPNYLDPKSQKLMREHTEINKLWKEISSQLDTLSNWHYKPHATQAHINVVTDVATIIMEDAQPTAGRTVSNTTALAPQEIYTPGADGRVFGEVVLRHGMSLSKQEMTRDVKSRLRRQHKKQKKSAVGSTSGKMTEKQQVVSDLKRGGVKLIGNQGDVIDIHGNKPTRTGGPSADALKL
ncbi:U3 small nucleolar ribonucleo protein complex, subunit Mpp10 [Aspergillus coremiiformis]|uniref:U3 small nucleolar ribonucleoprotein protein MPP10 n=1 Tax=Aspergillus coremiiformis TaxID=138285 RepID=A0A5N6YSI2_9EURO|nr:U3 small nucleolar ribonucleo protein complex, subunit Mpp10 [Aspergillus coremiiformis]